MTDTIRLLAALQALLPDNTAGLITPQNVRDFLVSAVPGGRGPTLVVASASASLARQASADYVCDGVADEVQINAAIAALPAGGGIVQLTEGQYNLSLPITNYPSNRGNFSLRGAGMDQTLLKLQTGANCRGISIAVAAAITDLDFRDFTLDGNGVNQTTPGGATRDDQSGLVINSPDGGFVTTDVTIERVKAQNTRFGNGFSLVRCNRLKLRDCIGLNNGQVDLALSGDAFYTKYLNDMIAVGLTGVGNHDTGLAQDFNQHTKLIGCHFENNDSQQLAFAKGSAYGLVVGCRLKGGSYGLRTGKFGGIPDPGASQFLVMVGNILSDHATAGILFEDHTIALVEGNYFHYSITTPAAYAGSNAFIIPKQNVGWLTEAGGTATIAAGVTSVVVSHGMQTLPQVPALKNIVVTPSGDWLAATKWWVSNPTATQFTINCSPAPGGAGLAFAWQTRMDV